MTRRIPWLKVAFTLLALLLGGVLLIFGRDLVVLTIIGAVLAYLLFPLVNRLERRGMKRTLAASIVFFGLTLLLVILGWTLIPLLAAEAAGWQSSLGNGEIYQLLDNLEADIAEHIPLVEPGSLGLSESARLAIETQESRALSYATDALSLLGNMVIIPFVLFFLLRDGSRIMKKMVSFVPNRYFEFTMGVIYKIDAHLGGYLRGQSVIALVVGLSTILGLGLVGVDYYVMLGVFTGFANFIPYVGFIISAALTLTLSALTTGGVGQVIGIILVFALVQTFENVVLQPTITAKNVSLHPISVLLAILLGGRLAGVVGMALAVPTVAVVKVILTETFVTLRRYRL